jgi:hypothetical protein
MAVTTKQSTNAGRSRKATRAALDLKHFIDAVHRLPDVRMDKVRQMRHLIARGKLATPERIDAAARRIVEELGL